MAVDEWRGFPNLIPSLSKTSLSFSEWNVARGRVARCVSLSDVHTNSLFVEARRLLRLKLASLLPPNFCGMSPVFVTKQTFKALVSFGLLPY